MEALRLEGNSYFTSDVTHALVCYLEAMKIYEEKVSKTKQICESSKYEKHQQNKLHKEEEQEYAKSAGNALTCLYKLHEYEMCSVVATRILLFNPILAKANVFLARCIAQLEHLPFTENTTANSNHKKYVEDSCTHTENCVELTKSHTAHRAATTLNSSSPCCCNCCNVNTDTIENRQSKHLSDKLASQMDAAVRMWTYLCRACYELPSLNSVVKDDMQNVLMFLLSKKAEHDTKEEEEWEIDENAVSDSHSVNCTTSKENVNKSHDSEMKCCVQKQKSKKCFIKEDYSHAIQITERGVCGRGVIASEFIPSHCVVSSLLSPFSVGLYIDYNNNDSNADITSSSSSINIDTELQFMKLHSEVCCLHCSKVFTFTETMLHWQCTRCKQAIYCSELCSSLHKERHNLYECNAFVKLHHMLHNIAVRQLDVPCEFAELAFHVITTVSALHTDSSKVTMTSNSTEHHDDKSKSRVETYNSGNKAETLIKMLDAHTDEVVQHLHPSLELLKELLPHESPELLAHILGAIRCNALQISDSSGYPLGQALYVHDKDNHCLSMCENSSSSERQQQQHLSFINENANRNTSNNKYSTHSECTSFFNHSCNPNCSLSGNCIITTRPVLCGEELTIAYIPHLYWPTERRRELLAERYFFTCHCNRCECGESHLTSSCYESTNYFSAAQNVVCENACNESCHLGSIAENIEHSDKSVDTRENSHVGNSISDGTSDYTRTFKEWKSNALAIYNKSKFQELQKKIVNNAFERAIQVTRVSENEVTHTWTAKVQVICNDARSLLVDEVDKEAIESVEKLYTELQEKIYPFHFLMHEVRNTLTFLYAVSGDHKKCLSLCAYELFMWECIIPGALPVKRMKLENMIRCLSGLGNIGDVVNLHSNNNIKDNSVDSNTVLIPFVNEL